MRKDTTVYKMAVDIASRLFRERRVSQLYQETRPRYTDTDVMGKILKFMSASLQPPYEKAADIGCGTGLSTQPLIPHFRDIVGIDPSPSQIEEAVRSHSVPNTKFLVGSAENLSSLSDASLDLLSVGTAIHYFDIDAFYKELDRVLKPGGTFAQFGYSQRFFEPRNLTFEEYRDHPAHDEVARECNELYNEVYKTLLGEESYQPAVDREESGVEPPERYTDQERYNGVLPHTIHLPSFMGFLQSLGLWQNYCREANVDTDTLANQYRERFTKILKRISDKPEEIPMKHHFTLFVIMARKPLE